MADASCNFNIPEAKIAKEVAQEFVWKRCGKILKQAVLRKETEVILQRVEEIEPKQGETLRNLVKSMNITEENGFDAFLRISDQCFDSSGDMNWGRLVTFFLFVGMTIDQLRRNGKDDFNDQIALWLGICISRKSQWIRENDGWPGFVKTMGGTKELRESFFNGLFNVTMGLGTIAAALYIQAK